MLSQSAAAAPTKSYQMTTIGPTNLSTIRKRAILLARKHEKYQKTTVSGRIVARYKWQ
jgi:hypothetical protein